MLLSSIFCCSSNYCEDESNYPTYKGVEQLQRIVDSQVSLTARTKQVKPYIDFDSNPTEQS